MENSTAYVLSMTIGKRIRSAIRRLFNPKGSIYYHEDDFCQVEIVPKENLCDILRQGEKIAENHSESGFWDIYVREKHSVSLKSREITREELENLFAGLETKKHTKVITGFGSTHRVISKNTIGYGKDYSVIYFDYENDIVNNIWVTNLFGLDNNKVSDILSIIGRKWNLVMVDWNRSEIIDLSNKECIKDYLR